jgi:hypothetical protein
MFVTTGTLYDKDETLKYNKLYLEELRKHKDHKNLVQIAQLKREAHDMSLEDMKNCNHKNLKEIIKLNNIALNGLKSVLRIKEGQESVPVEYAIEVISKMELGISNPQFQSILAETMMDDVVKEEEVIITVIDKIQNILASYKTK